MGAFSFVPLGVGDAFSALYYSSCLVLEAEGTRLLVDCPHPIRKIMREAGNTLQEPLDVEHIDAIVLTHLHADHCSGIEGFGFFSYFLLKKKPLIISHPEVSKRLWPNHLSAGMEQLQSAGELTEGLKRIHEIEPPTKRGFDDYFSLLDLNKDRAITYGPFSIECRETIHHVPTTALRIRVGDRLLGYSADSAFDPSLIEWLSEADTIIHETNYGTHTPYEKLAALPAALRDKMYLIHYPDDFDLGASCIEPLDQGKRYPV